MLDGPSVVGFWGLFEADFGDPRTPTPYPRVTPSRAGARLLPFPCPHCGGAVDFGDEATRDHYRDHRPGRGNYWCPRCGGRFTLNVIGRQVDDVVIGVNGAAEAVVERAGRDKDGLVAYRRNRLRPMRRSTVMYLLGCDVLGAV